MSARRAKPQADGPQVDYSALRVNAALTAMLLAMALGTNFWGFVAYVGAVLLISALNPGAAQFTLAYFRLLKPAGIVKPDVRADRPEPHLFSQLIGGLLLLAATILLVARLPLIGWPLVWLVLAAALVQLLTGVCLGCRLYTALQRIGFPVYPSQPNR